MIGAIIGDIVGSRFEWDNHRSKVFDFLTHNTCNLVNNTCASFTGTKLRLKIVNF